MQGLRARAGALLAQALRGPGGKGAKDRGPARVGGLSPGAATGVAIRKGEADPPILPDAEYPDWLFKLLQPEPTVAELERAYAAEGLPLPQLKRLFRYKNKLRIKAQNAASAKNTAQFARQDRAAIGVTEAAAAMLGTPFAAAGLARVSSAELAQALASCAGGGGGRPVTPAEDAATEALLLDSIGSLVADGVIDGATAATLQASCALAAPPGALAQQLSAPAALAAGAPEPAAPWLRGGCGLRPLHSWGGPASPPARPATSGGSMGLASPHSSDLSAAAPLGAPHHDLLGAAAAAPPRKRHHAATLAGSGDGASASCDDGSAPAELAAGAAPAGDHAPPAWTLPAHAGWPAGAAHSASRGQARPGRARGAQVPAKQQPAPSVNHLSKQVNRLEDELAALAGAHEALKAQADALAAAKAELLSQVSDLTAKYSAAVGNSCTLQRELVRAQREALQLRAANVALQAQLRGLAPTAACYGTRHALLRPAERTRARSPAPRARAGVLLAAAGVAARPMRPAEQQQQLMQQLQAGGAPPLAVSLSELTPVVASVWVPSITTSAPSLGVPVAGLPGTPLSVDEMSRLVFTVTYRRQPAYLLKGVINVDRPQRFAGGGAATPFAPPLVTLTQGGREQDVPASAVRCASLLADDAGATCTFAAPLFSVGPPPSGAARVTLALPGTGAHVTAPARGYDFAAALPPPPNARFAADGGAGGGALFAWLGGPSPTNTALVNNFFEPGEGRLLPTAVSGTQPPPSTLLDDTRTFTYTALFAEVPRDKCGRKWEVVTTATVESTSDGVQAPDTATSRVKLDLLGCDALPADGTPPSWAGGCTGATVDAAGPPSGATGVRKDRGAPPAKTPQTGTAKHAAKQHVAKRPAAKQPVAKQPAAKQPAAKQPAAKQTVKVAAKHAARPPASRKPAKPVSHPVAKHHSRQPASPPAVPAGRKPARQQHAVVHTAKHQVRRPAAAPLAKPIVRGAHLQQRERGAPSAAHVLERGGNATKQEAGELVVERRGERVLVAKALVGTPLTPPPAPWAPRARVAGVFMAAAGSTLCGRSVCSPGETCLDDLACCQPGASLCGSSCLPYGSDAARTAAADGMLSAPGYGYGHMRQGGYYGGGGGYGGGGYGQPNPYMAYGRR
ncbi:hypothetical protein HT031_005029 [Scenedesmus sp. PABB004]|nr:hypothetical protein HT031_005029 [Scenedesmus sp. PABB004]